MALQEVAAGVHAYVQGDGGWCLNNAGVVVDGAESAVLDTAATLDRALALREAVRGLVPKPPRAVVNTHFHGDHTFGNCVFTGARGGPGGRSPGDWSTPDAVVVAHERTRTAMAEAGLHLTTLWPEVCWGDISLELPDLTYSERLTLHIGSTAVELMYPGPAHTTDDSVVWLPEQRVLFTGDVLMSGVTPFIAMGSLSGSLETIAALRKLGAEVIVPGHGPVGGPELLDTAERYFHWLRELARAARAAGLSPLEAAREAELGEFADLLDSERLVPNLHRAYAEEDGAEPGSHLDIGELFADMIRHHGRLPACHA